MEENIQRILAVIVSILIFFIFPIYIAFEKKDDVSYALALKITTEFVDQVKSNGFITEDMYLSFVSELAATSNTYEIDFEHKAYKYYPVINAYSDEGVLLESFDFELYKEQMYSSEYIVYKGEEYSNLIVEYSTSLEIYTEKQILDVFSNSSSNIYFNTTDEDGIRYNYTQISIDDISLTPNIYAVEGNSSIYTFNEGDEFNVIVTNTNTTVAESLFNAFTVYMSTDVPRVYVNYGGIIAAEKYKDN